MIPWPDSVPTLATLPTIPKLKEIPADYFKTVADGRFFQSAFFPTEEPTSESLEGVTIHALAVPGKKLTVPGAPATLVPFAKDEARYFCFDLKTRGPAVRYLDTEVDQWLTLAPSWAAFKAGLKKKNFDVEAALMSNQALAHAILTTTGAALTPLLLSAREHFGVNAWLDWLFVLQEKEENQAVLIDEFDFARRFLWNKLDDNHRARLGVFSPF